MCMKPQDSVAEDLAMLMQVGTLNYMSPEAILGGTNNIRGAPPMKVCHLPAASAFNVFLQLAMLICWPLPFRAVSYVYQPISIVNAGIRYTTH